MRKKLLLRIPILLWRGRAALALAGLLTWVGGTVWAQTPSTANYSFSDAAASSITTDRNGNTIDMSSGTTTLLVPTSAGGDFASGVANIGFPFVFMGTAYSQFSANSNGLLRFGPNAVSAAFTNDLTVTTNMPQLAPFWEDLNNEASSPSKSLIHSKVVGTAPNRCLVVEWKDFIIRYNVNTTNANDFSTFQVRLYETSGIIEYVYGKMVIASGNTSVVTASIGFSDADADDRVLSVTSLASPAVTTNTASVNNSLVNISTPGVISDLDSTVNNFKRFSFVPGNDPSGAPGGVTVSSITASSAVVSWSDNANNELGYYVFISSGSFSRVISLPANSTTTTITGLIPDTNYQVYVGVFTEGKVLNSSTASFSTLNGTVSGTKTICPSGCDYQTITAAISDARTNQLAGNLVWQLNNTYVSTSETFPIDYSGIITTATRGITLRPASNVSSTLEINASNTNSIFRFDGGDYLTIDGRPGGTGTNIRLKFVNTSTSGTVLSFINDAQYNTVRYVEIAGSSTITPFATTPGAMVYFGGSNQSEGNDFNTISNCEIHGEGSTLARFGVYGIGSSAGLTNDGITISDCNIYDFFAASSSFGGIMAMGSTSGWTIKNNSIYQTTTRTVTSGLTNYGIQISNTTNGEGFKILDNFIGGTEPQAGGSQFVLNIGTSTAVSTSFRPIDAATLSSATTNTEIKGNTIANLSITSSNISTIIPLINISTGRYEVENNTIGSQTATSNISYTFQSTSTSTGTPALSAIYMSQFSPSFSVIKNNTIGGIRIAKAASSGGFTRLNGIFVSGADSLVFENNTIGGSVANSMEATEASGSATIPAVCGIYSTTSSLKQYYRNNTIRNLTSSFASTTTNLSEQRVVGIYTTFGLSQVNGNTIRDLRASSGTGTLTSASVMGIYHNSTSTGTVGINLLPQINGNRIFNLSNTIGSGDLSIFGIYLTGSTTTFQKTVDGNFIHSFAMNSTGTGSNMVGIYQAGGVITFTNNMIRLGIDGLGNSLSANLAIFGYQKQAGSTVFLHNSIYVGGSGIASSSINTAAFRRSGTGADNVFNNIFVNARSNASGTAKHYAASYSDATGTVFSDGNLYNASGTGGNLVQWGTTDYNNLRSFRNFRLGSGATNADVNSLVGSPSFVNATGSAAAVDLHVNSTTPVESTGVELVVSLNDYDGDARSGLSPVDIGADAGNFTFGPDIAAPRFTYTPLFDTTSVSNRNLSVTITDQGTGVPTTGTNRPKIWFRKQGSGSWVSNYGTLSSGNGNNGVWTFVIDYSLLSLTPAVGDVFEYYIVAQDQASPVNVNYDPYRDTDHSDVNTQVTVPASPRNYAIQGTISGLKTVCPTGCDYPNLTGTNGVFNALNRNIVNANTTFRIDGDLSEPGTVRLDTINYSASGLTVTITAGTGAAKLISNNGDLSDRMIEIIRAKNLTIDGGADRKLIFRNTHSNPSACRNTFIVFAGAQVKFRGCKIENNAVLNTLGAATFWVVNTAYPVPILVDMDNCVVGGTSESTIQTASIPIYVDNAQCEFKFRNSEVANYTLQGLTVVNSADNVLVEGNSFYAEQSNSLAAAGMLINTDRNVKILNNFIGGTAKNLGGNLWEQSGTTSFIGIAMNGVLSAGRTYEVRGNKIAKINRSSTTTLIRGISRGSSSNAGNLIISGNTIGGLSQADSISSLANSSFEGIYLVTSTLSTGKINVDSNIVSNIYFRGTGASINMQGIEFSGTPSNLAEWRVKGNTISNFLTNSTSTVTGSTASIIGIIFNCAATGPGFQEITENTIHNLSNANTSLVSAHVLGIYLSGSTGANRGRILNNRIYDLRNSVTGTAAAIKGVYLFNASWQISNNQIALSNQGNSNGIFIAGIDEDAVAASFMDYFHNTIYVGGTASSGARYSYGMYFRVNMTPNLKNNFIYNARSGGAGRHMAMGNISSTISNWATGASDYNVYVLRNTSDFGEWPAGTFTNFTTWKNNFKGDANSSLFAATQFPISEVFPNLSNNDLTSNSCILYQNGTPITQVTIDFNNAPRSTTAPSVGAFEIISTTGLTAITTQPSDVEVCEQSSVTISMVSQGANKTVQWQRFDGTNFVNLTNGGIYSGVTTDNLVISDATGLGTQQYRAIVSGDCKPNSVTSDTVTLTEKLIATITDEPVDRLLCDGQATSFEIAAVGSDLTYRWQQSISNGPFSDVPNAAPFSGVTNNKLDISSITGLDGRRYRCIVSGFCNNDTSYAAKLDVLLNLTISTQPASQSICTGSAASFTVQANGSGLTYQWKEDGVDLTNTGVYSGVNTNTLTISNVAGLNGKQYTCELASPCVANPVLSNQATLTVLTLPSITTQPVSVEACSDQGASMSVVATGSGITYQWQFFNTSLSTFANIVNGGVISGAQSPTLSVSSVNGLGNLTIRCVVSGTCTPAAISNEVTLTELKLPAVVTQPASVQVCSNQGTSFTVSATGHLLTYQWKEDGNNLSDGGIYSGVNTATLSISSVNGLGTKTYTCEVNGFCGSPVTTNAAVLTELFLPTITTEPIDRFVCQDSATSFEVAATGTALTYRWETFTGAVWVPVPEAGVFSGTTTTNLRIANVNGLNGRGFRAIVSGSCTPPDTSATAVLNVQLRPVITRTTRDTTVCIDQSATFFVEATGSNLTYQWQSSSNGADWENLSNNGVYSDVNTGALKLSSVTGLDSVRYRCLIGGSCPPDLISTPMQLTVKPRPALPSARIIGDSYIGRGANSVPYSYPGVIEGAESLVWEYSGTGAFIVGNSNNIFISFAPDATSGELTVRGINICGQGPVSASLFINTMDTTIWNGSSWSNGLPARNRVAVVAGNYSGSGFEVGDLIVEADQTFALSSGEKLDIFSDVYVREGGKIIDNNNLSSTISSSFAAAEGDQRVVGKNITFTNLTINKNFGDIYMFGDSSDVSVKRTLTMNSGKIIVRRDTVQYSEQIISGNNDAQEWLVRAGQRRPAGEVSTQQTELALGNEFPGLNPTMVGLRFTNLNIPKDANILRAYLEVTVDSSRSGTFKAFDNAEEWLSDADSGLVGRLDKTVRTGMLLGQNNDTIADGSKLTAIRFTNIAIPRGATIAEAYIQFTVDSVNQNQDPCDLTIRGFNLDNVGQFGVLDSADISSRPFTTQSVAWNVRGATWQVPGSSEFDQRTPDLKSIVQAIVNRTGWNPGQTLGFAIRGNGTRIVSNAQSQGAPVLFIKYLSTNAQPATLAIRVENNANSTEFSNAVLNLSNRSLSLDSVIWNATGATWQVIGRKQQTPDISALVQKVVSRRDWNPGNAMSFYITGTGSRVIESSDNGNPNAPSLVLEFETGFRTVTFKSSPDGTAMYFQNNDNSFIDGDYVRYERYITPLSGFGNLVTPAQGVGLRLLASPLTGRNHTAGNIKGITPNYFDANQFNNNWNSINYRNRFTYPNVLSYSTRRISRNDSLNGGDQARGSFMRGWVAAANDDDLLPRGIGIQVGVKPTDVVSFLGRLDKVADTVVGGLSREAFTASGWTLVGNPYPSPMFFERDGANNDFLDFNPGVDKAFYTFLPTSHSQGRWVALVNGVSSPKFEGFTGEIPTMQSFLVRKTEVGVSNLVFNNAMRQTAFTNPRLNREQAVVSALVRLNVRNAAGNNDEMVTYFSPDASNGFDVDLDAYKVLPILPEVTTVFAEVNKNALAINALPTSELQKAASSTGLTLPISVVADRAGVVTFSISERVGLSDTLSVYLRDNVLGVEREIAGGKSYSTALQPGLYDERFSIWVVGRQTGLDDKLAKAGINIYSFESSAFVEFTDPKMANSTITIFDLQGREVARRANRDAKVEIPLSVSTGIYIVKVTNEHGTFARKVYIE